MAHKHYANIFLIAVTYLCLTNIRVHCQAPSTFSYGQFYPTKSTTDASQSEVLQCRSIRDVIKRGTARFLKVLVRNDNPQIDFAANEDNKYMTSRAKSKLDVLASRAQSNWGSGVKLRVIKAWTDVVDKNDMLSLHYEGRTLKIQVSDGDRNKLGQLCGLAAKSGFDWIYYQNRDFIRVSVIPDVCQTKLDMAFVIDTSGSVGYTNFQTVQRFLKDLVDFYNIGTDQTAIGLISYSYSVYKEFYLNSYSTKSAIKSAIDRMKYEGSMTATGDALLHMKSFIFNTNYGMRSDKSIPKIGILLTDGRSNHGTSVYSAAQQVKQAGINMFVIGVGSNLRTSELNDVASDPDSEHVFKLSGFRDLSDFVDQMSTTSCDEGAQLSKCESAETAVDGGSFKYFRGSFSSNTVNVTIEVVDKEGRSYLYTSLVNKNPGPLDPDSDTQKNKNDISPRALSVTLSSTKLLYISVQGQEDKNSFLLNIWDSLFTSDEYKETVLENQAAGQHVATITSHLTGYTFLYSIKYGNGAGHFTINQNTGKVTTTRQLNRESVAKYSLVIVAQDANLKCHKGRTLLTVTVGDLNDNAPSFIGDPYSFRVREDSSPNSYIGTVRATDADAGSNGKLRYSLSSGTGKDDFTLDRDTGVLRVARYLDYDQRQKKYDLQILVQDTGSPVKTDVAVLVINIININEPPTFTGDCAGGCSVSINEGNTVGRVVKTLTATDPDTTLQCTLQYEIVSSDKHYFNINPTTGLITTSKPIDRELKEVYLLIVDVKDCSDPPLKDRTTVTVTALDVNDNAPAFPVSRYSATVLENQYQGTVVVTVSATDVDFGTNSQIAYTIESGNTGGDFSINSVSGLVTTARALDRESVAKFTLRVCASDAGQPIKKTCVPLDVSVDDINDNAPTFQGQKTFMVTENVARGTHVGTVQTADRDIGINANIRCSITDGNTNNAFSMDASTCAITTAGVIDRESIASYSLRIKIADLGQPSLSATTRYVISVRDVNDNSPVFTMGTYWATVLENANTNTHVTKVAATDKDQGTNSNIKYTIQSGDDAVPKFAIDRNTGNITLIGALSFGVRNSYRLKVKAEDSASSPRFGTADVVITVQDTNDFSPVFRPTTYSKDIAEGSAIGTVVVDVNATDQDTGPSGILAYSIESGNTNNAFMIVSHTGEIKINRELDYEGIKLYNLGVKASDSGSPAKHASATVRIAVTDINDNAPAFTSTSFSMSAFENATNGHVIGKVTANDYDSGSNSRLTFESTTTGIPFTVDSNGDVKVSSVLDFERTKKYTINVKVSDAGSPVLSATSQVVVSIIDVNDNTPVFTGAPYTCEILENSPSGSAVCYVVATDADAGVNAQLEYMISEGPFNGCPFSVDSSTGQIKTQQYLNREARASYKCQVTATDFGKPSRSSSSNVTINVKDDNDNTPIANPASYTFHIQEEQNTNLTVGRVLATDADQGDNSKLTYSLEGVVGSQHFSINAATGVISALAKLDRETGSSYAMSVKVSDNGIPSLFVNVPVAIIVDDINDNGPVFSKAVYSGRVREDSAIGSNVIQVSATDADAGSNAVITYEITGGAHGGNFSIDANTGLIVTKMALDYETLASYELTVTAKDSGVPQKTSTCKAAITIVNVDDNAPEFGKITEAKVSEGVQTGTPVVKFNATDKDGSVLTYSITQGNTGNAFEIDGSTGQLRVKNPLDRETVPNYNLTVAVTDASSKVTTTHLPIKVLDINDNTPQFQKAAYSQSVNENGATVMSVTRVRALDNDEGTNAAIEYVIESGATKDQFRIQPNGDIETTQVLDRETTAIHTLVVAAKDGGTPSLKSTVVVTVTVKDKNDNAPVFDQVVPKQITENCGDAATVTVVRATDKDAGTYGSVSYKLISENGATGSSAFGIGTSSGAVYTRINLDREATSFYTLVIEANDNPEFTAKKTSRAVLNVTVLDENDNSPKLVSPLLIAPVSEDASVGTLVAKFQATDDDIGVNAEVTFEIVAGNLNDAFVLNASSGELRLAKAIDREQTASYQLKVRVQDKGNPVLRSAKSFGVTVKDVNDNGPAFVKTVFKGTVDENVATGTPVLIVSATDADEGTNSQITYQLDTTAPATAFSINATTGQIFTASALDYEATKSYKFTAIVSDGKFQSSTDVEIEIGNLNDNSPVFDKAYNVNVSEGSAVSSAVLTVVATDKDSFGALTYSLLNSTAFFSIDSQSGQIRTTVGLDREMKSVYFVGVRASDGGSPQLSAQTTVTISVTDVNDNAPYFALSSASVSVSENKLVQSFYTASATDQDAGVNAQIEYSIENGPSSSKFAIESLTGKISTAVELDRESVSSHTITIVARDRGQPRLTSQPLTLSITVIDVNDNAPVFAKSYDNESMSEGASVGAVVLGLLASDLDTGSNAVIGYAITGGNVGNVFKIDNTTGVVSLENKLDRELVAKYTLQVEAKDHGVPSQATIVSAIINIADINDNAPVFDNQTLTGMVKENKMAGTHVVTVKATDADTGENGRIAYSMKTNDAFTINAATGEVTTLKPLDREEKAQYAVEVTAKDHGSVPLSKTTQLTINIGDEDDNCPIFSPKVYTARIKENDPRGTIVVNVTATDDDVGRNAELVYAIKAGDDQGVFTVDPRTGSVMVAGIVDREFSDFIHLKVRGGNIDCGLKPLNDSNVGEGGAEQANNQSLADVFIHVIDINDNAPKFKQNVLNYNFRSIGAKKLLNLSATDPDLGPGGIVKYRMNTTKRVDNHGTVRRDVIVEAYDRGTPPMSSRAVVKVHNIMRCNSMSFRVTEAGELSAATLCSFNKMPEGSFKRLVGKSFKLECEAVGNEAVLYRWLKDGNSIAAWSSSGLLEFAAVTKNDAGRYACLATNGGGTMQSTNAELIVQETPKFTKHPESSSAEIGGTAVFECDAIADPRPYYRWYKNGEVYQQGVGFRSNTLKLPELIQNDEGQYFCEAYNLVGKTRSNVAVLKVFEKESVLKLRVNLNKPNKGKTCHFFIPASFQKLLNGLTAKKISVTKYEKSKVCNVTACQPNPCANKGKCDITKNGFICSCKGGWDGTTCKNDINECTRSAVDCQKGKCNNIKGSYWCSCPPERMGRNCQLFKSVCNTNPCGLDNFCLPLPNSPSGNRTCIAKKNRFELAMQLEDGQIPWQDYMKYTVEENMNEAVQNWKFDIAQRRRRSVASGSDVRACVIRITNTEKLADNKIKVEYVFVCPADLQANITVNPDYLCSNMLKSLDGSTDCKSNGQLVATKAPADSLPALDFNLEIVVRDAKTGKALGADEALDVIQNKNVLSGLENENIKVQKVSKAVNPEPRTGNNNKSRNTAIAATLAVVGCIALVGLAVFVYRRRQNQNNSEETLTMSERIAQRRQSKEDLLRADILMSNVDGSRTNDGFEGGLANRESRFEVEDTFMIDAPGKLKQDAEAKRNEQLEALPWYKGQLTRKQVEDSFEQCTTPGSYIAYKSPTGVLTIAVKSPEGGPCVHHLDVNTTANGGFVARFGNNDAITRDVLQEIIEHYQVSSIKFGNDVPDVIFTEPWLRISI